MHVVDDDTLACVRCGLAARPGMVQRATPGLHGPAAAWGVRVRVPVPPSKGVEGGKTMLGAVPAPAAEPISLSGRNSRQRWATAPHLPFPDRAAGCLCNGRRDGRASNGRAFEWKGSWAATARP